jgi:hypothetical protein
MGTRWIDSLGRLLATGAPRRRVISSLAAGPPAALLALRGDQAAAGCKKVGRTCDKNSDCCDGAACKGGECKCKRGFEDCEGNGKCANLDKDRDHCGRCGTACPNQKLTQCCGGLCVNTLRDRNHCGACNRACVGIEVCEVANCLPPD